MFSYALHGNEHHPCGVHGEAWHGVLTEIMRSGRCSTSAPLSVWLLQLWQNMATQKKANQGPMMLLGNQLAT